MTQVTNKEWTYDVTVPSGNDGTAQVTITALDAADNPVGTQAGDTFMVDNIRPTVALTYNDMDPFREGDTVTVTATFTDASDIAGTPQIDIAYAGGGSDSGAMTQVTNKEWTYDIEMPSGNDGTARVTITAQDAADNPVDAHTDDTFMVDNTAPTVALTYDDTDPYRDADTVTVTATFTDVSDIAGTPQIVIAYAGSGTDSGAMTQVTNKEWTYAIDVPSGNDGTAQITIAVLDAADNPVGAHSGETFRVDNTADAPSGLDLAAADDLGASDADNRTKQTAGLDHLRQR